jgi:hypothetical protein
MGFGPEIERVNPVAASYNKVTLAKTDKDRKSRKNLGDPHSLPEDHLELHEDEMDAPLEGEAGDEDGDGHIDISA